MVSTGSNRVIRGGSWNNNPRNVRAANRNHNAPDNRDNNLGFRLVSTRHRPRARFTDLVSAHQACPAGRYPVPTIVGQRAYRPWRLVDPQGSKTVRGFFIFCS